MNGPQKAGIEIILSKYLYQPMSSHIIKSLKAEITDYTSNSYTYATQNSSLYPLYTSTATNYTCTASNTSDNDTFTLDYLKEVSNCVKINNRTEVRFRAPELFFNGTSGTYIGGTDYSPRVDADNFYWNIPVNKNNARFYAHYDSDGLYDYEATLRATKRFNIKSKLHNDIKTRAISWKKVPENEQIALESLREIITEKEFRKYIKYGFVMVPAKSGKVYQIFRNAAHTKVWYNGKIIEEVCVRIKSQEKVPPTDNVVAFKNMIEISEEDFRSIGNVYKNIGNNEHRNLQFRRAA